VLSEKKILNETKNHNHDSAQMISELGITINDNLCQARRNKLIQLLLRNRNVFAKDLSELEKTNLHYHRIDTGDAAPVRSAPYR
jgi:transcriptional regulator CtsR